MIRILFVTHDISIYGASRSLQTLLRNYNTANVHIDLMITTRLIRSNDLGDVREKFGPHVREIFEFYLPFELCEVGKPKPTPGLWVKNKLSQLTRPRFYAFLREKKYDLVHLNSLVLHSLISAEFPFLIHVREIFDFSQQSVYRSLDAARGIVFIDESTAKPFENRYIRKSVVLNNPFDMRADTEETHQLSNEPRTIFAMIGKIKDSKGNFFVLKSFLKAANNKNAVLVFAGTGDDSYEDECKRYAEGHTNIIFLGEEPRIGALYSVSDFIIRGEAAPCIGRTIYEGLYSGGQAIIPGTPSDFDNGFTTEFAGEVHYYEPRNEDQLTLLFSRLTGTKITGRKFRSNVDEYVTDFHAFVLETINGHQR